MIDEVGKYIDQYYELAKDDLKMDKEMISILIRLQNFVKKELKKKPCKKNKLKTLQNRRCSYVDRRHFSKNTKKMSIMFRIRKPYWRLRLLWNYLWMKQRIYLQVLVALSRSSKTDIIVAYFLQNKIYDMFEINDVLDAYGQPVF